MTSRLALVVLLTAVFGACSCESKNGGGGPQPSHRCEADLSATGLFSTVGNSSRARVIRSADELLGGEAAEGRVGDVLLENDRIRVVISQPGRHFGPVPYGGWIVDADLQRATGEGRDQFGRLGMLYAFGRTINATHVDILDDGSGGGPAVVAVTGNDALNDFISIKTQLGNFLPGNVQLAIDPDKPIALKATTYYVLSPGESRVRMYTQFCNESPEIVSIPLGDLFDQGGSTEFFNPTGCKGGLGNDGCLIDPATGIGFQGDGVAYGYRGYRYDDFAVPSTDAALGYSGVVGVLAGAENSNGVLSWMDSQASRRPGTFGIRAGEKRAWLRDFFVTRDLAEFNSTLLTLDGQQQGRLNVTVQQPGNAGPAADARVAIVGGDGKMKTLMVTDADGKARADVPPGTYKVYVGALGHALEAPVDATVGTNGTLDLNLALGPSRTLTVTVQDPFGGPLPAKVTVLCPSGTCPTGANHYSRIADVETHPTNVATFAWVPPQGTLAIRLPPAQYEVVVTRGPEYSAWPETWPQSGQPVDLTSADAQLTATLAQVVDTTGWMSADLHVHSVNSPDSSVRNDHRVLSFLAEHVDVLVSTDHDFVTDYAPVIQRLGAQGFMTSMIGSEVSTFDFGHFNAFPMQLRDLPRGGPFDWAGGDGATLRATQLFAGIRAEHPSALIQLNHPRGRSGIFSALKVDTDTLATHADPAGLRMEAAPDATAANTRLMDDNFDVIEIANGLTASTDLLNDWMTQLSSGRLKAGTAVSDTHQAFSTLGGYSRTYVNVGVDTPAQFDPNTFAQRLRGLQAIGTNAPFVRVSARKLDGQGNPVGTPVEIGGTLSVLPSMGEKVELTVEVQSPEWIRFNRIEVFTHADGREAKNGASNNEWPPERIHAFRDLDPTLLPVEAVPNQNGLTFRRIRAVETFTLTPAADTWYVVIVRSTGAVGTLFPLAYRSVNCDGNLCTSNAGRAYAFTNPILVDADGSGAYDNFPQKMSRSVKLPPPPPPAPAAPRPPTLEEFNAALREWLSHNHQDGDH